MLIPMLSVDEYITYLLSTKCCGSEGRLGVLEGHQGQIIHHSVKKMISCTCHKSTTQSRFEGPH